MMSIEEHKVSVLSDMQTWKQMGFVSEQHYKDVTGR